MWFDSLKALTPKALESGMERLKSLSAGQKFCEFPPNCLQFKSLCLAFYDDLRLPKASDAYQEIKMMAYRSNQHWSHEVVKFTASRLTAKFYAIEQEQEAYALFKKSYEQVCAHNLSCAYQETQEEMLFYVAEQARDACHYLMYTLEKEIPKVVIH